MRAEVFVEPTGAVPEVFANLGHVKILTAFGGSCLARRDRTSLSPNAPDLLLLDIASRTAWTELATRQRR
jgi:hypothetical protein